MGFQRAREAYEIARASGDLESIASGSGRRHHAPVFFEGPPAAAATETAGSSDSRQAPAAAPTPAAPGGGDRPQADVIFDGFSSAWNSVPPSADQRQRLEIAREAVAVLPDDPRAHWLLVTTLSRLGPDTALADALRAGWRAGWPEFLEALLVRLPGRATREEIDAAFSLQRSGDAARGGGRRRRLGPQARRRPGRRAVPDRDGRAAGCARRSRARSSDPAPAGRHPRAACSGCGGCRRGSAGGAAQLPAGERPRVGAGARSAGRRSGRWPRRSPACHREFPQTLRTAFAIATRTGDLSSAYVDAARLIVSDRGHVRRWATRLVTRRPTSRSFAARSRSRRPVRRAAPGFQVSRFAYLLIPLSLAVIRTLRLAPQPSSSPPISPRSTDPAYLMPLATDPGLRVRLQDPVRRWPPVKRATTCAARTDHAAVSRWSAPTLRPVKRCAITMRRPPEARRGGQKSRCAINPRASPTPVSSPARQIRALAACGSVSKRKRRATTHDRRDRSRHHFLAGRGDARRRARRAPNALGDMLTPSAVSLLDGGDMLVGAAARARATTHPERTALVWKRDMGTERMWRVADRSFTPPELSALVLRSLKHDAEAALGQPSKRRWSPCPPTSTTRSGSATRDAGAIAGLRVERIINEPTAAALAFGLHERHREMRAVVFDLGGGTFDVTVLEIIEGVIEIQSSAGDSRLGGEDFAEALACAVAEQASVPLEHVARRRRSRGRACSRRARTRSARCRGPRRRASPCPTCRSTDAHASARGRRSRAPRRRCCWAPLLDRLRAPDAARAARRRPRAGQRQRGAAGRRRHAHALRDPSGVADLRPRPRSAAAARRGGRAGRRGAGRAEGGSHGRRRRGRHRRRAVHPRHRGRGGVRRTADPRHVRAIIDRGTVIPSSRVKSFSTMSDNQKEILVEVFQGEHASCEKNRKLGSTACAACRPGRPAARASTCDSATT